MTIPKKEFDTAEWFVSVFLVFCMCIPILAISFARPAQVPACKTDGFGNVPSDSQIDGKLAFVTGGFAVRTADNVEHFIAYCHKACTGPYQTLKRERIGRPVHAEFCGKFLTMVSLDRVPVYTAHPPSQEELNEGASAGHIVGFSLLLVFFVLLCIGFFHKRKA